MVKVRPCPPASRTLLGSVRALLGDRNGATGVEYGLIAALIVLAIVGSIKALGEDLVSLPLASIVNALS
jgi:Flp pilus assembly pilin Flp